MLLILSILTYQFQHTFAFNLNQTTMKPNPTLAQKIVKMFPSRKNREWKKANCKKIVIWVANYKSGRKLVKQYLDANGKALYTQTLTK